MGLASIVRNGIAIADKITKDLQAPVLIQRWISEGRSGTPGREASPITVMAIIEPDKNKVPNPSGGAMIVTSKITILTPMAAQGAAGRDEPIDQRDLVTLPDGSTCPIFRVLGYLTDPSTNYPYMIQVSLVRG